MNHLELFLYASALSLEAAVCGLVCFRNVFRHLPLFSIYAFVGLISDIIGGVVSYHSGYRSPLSFFSIWTVVGVGLAARCLAIAELCQYKLRAYQGIWELTWRILIFLAVLFIAHAAVDAWGQTSAIEIYGLTIQRDVAASSVIILIAIMLIHNYYGLLLEPLQMWVAAGMAVLSMAEFVNNTLLRNAFTGYLSVWFFSRYMSLWPQVRSQVESVNEFWNVIRSTSFLVSLGIWCFALRKPLPAPKRGPELLPAEIYAEISPAVNLRLRAINDRLLELLKP
jgi:hypothetical protein